jgi:hypothetical protein
MAAAADSRGKGGDEVRYRILDDQDNEIAEFEPEQVPILGNVLLFRVTKEVTQKEMEFIGESMEKAFPKARVVVLPCYIRGIRLERIDVGHAEPTAELSALEEWSLECHDR